MIAIFTLSESLAIASCRIISVVRCSSAAGRDWISCSEHVSDHILGFRWPRCEGERQSLTIPVPLRWMRYPGVDRLRSPDSSAFKLFSWSESPQWMTMSAAEALAERREEES